MDMPNLGYVAYENENGLRLYFTYTLMNQGNGFSNDNEHSDYIQTTVGDSPADLFIANAPGEFNYLLWIDEDLEIAYKLSSDVDDADLIAVAESVKKIN